jgi:hypothetical protein
VVALGCVAVAPVTGRLRQQGRRHDLPRVRPDGYSEQSQTLDDLLGEHDLEVASSSNLIGVSRSVDDFCGSPALGGMPATQNLDRPLNDAVDWNAKQW